MKYSMMALAAAALMGSAMATPITPGTPITTPPPGIVALGGPVTAVYVFADAYHYDILGGVTPPPAATIFCNHAISGTCAANNPGDMQGLGPYAAGPLVFELKDTNTGNNFWTNAPDVDGNYHAFVTTNYSDFGLGAMPAAAAAALASLPNVTFIGWEDKMLGDPNPDWDYNDLIFAFSATRPSNNNVPEPLTLSLMGAGLLGAFGLRRVKKNK